MKTTVDWAHSLGISVDATPAEIGDYSELCPRSAREIAIRALILQGVVAVAHGVDADAIIEWFKGEGIWDNVSADELAFLRSEQHSDEQRIKFTWHVEAEWTLLWAVGKVESLGLPVNTCDTRRLVDEIIPALGSTISEFLVSAEHRSPGILLAEDDRTYNLWCYLVAARRMNSGIPEDLNQSVLYERRYAFEWLAGVQEWDEVSCDA
jgi:hypothetical protein